MEQLARPDRGRLRSTLFDVRIVGSALGNGPRESGLLAAAPGTMHAGADGVCVESDERTWYLPFPRLDAIEIRGNVVNLISGGRILIVRVVDAEADAAAVRAHIERRMTAFARAEVLYKLEANRNRVADRMSTSGLFGCFENPAAPAEVRVQMAQWIARRELHEADVAYVQRVLSEVADPDAARRISEALELPTTDA